MSLSGNTHSVFLKSKPARHGVLLRHSRTAESNAGQPGLISMAMAGNDPDGALDFRKPR